MSKKAQYILGSLHRQPK